MVALSGRLVARLVTSRVINGKMGDYDGKFGDASRLAAIIIADADVGCVFEACRMKECLVVDIVYGFLRQIMRPLSRH